MNFVSFIFWKTIWDLCTYRNPYGTIMWNKLDQKVRNGNIDLWSQETFLINEQGGISAACGQFVKTGDYQLWALEAATQLQGWTNRNMTQKVANEHILYLSQIALVYFCQTDNFPSRMRNELRAGHEDVNANPPMPNLPSKMQNTNAIPNINCTILM